MAAPLPLPGFYDPAHASAWDYAPEAERLRHAATLWRERHDIPPAGRDRARVELLLVDMQRDFCFPQGTLYVGGRSGDGALGDSDRVARFLYRSLARLTSVTCTLDTHFPFQIFFASFWRDAAGRPLEAHREVNADDVRSGRAVPDPELAPWLAGGDEGWLRRQALFYCEELERAGRYRLYLWPPHCLLGGDGHALVGVIQEARLFHAYARSARNPIETKGGHPLTENYSVLSPEVLLRHDGRPLAERNDAFLEKLLSADALVIAGQAASHCVKSTLDDLLAAIQARGSALARKVYVLRDGMSSVAVPDPARAGSFLFDFTEQAEQALARYADAGMNVVQSTTPIEDWPGFPR